jgi:hypothetical protein
MTRSAYYQLVDRALDGELEARLDMWIRARISKRAAAALLNEELGIDPPIHPDTIRRWMADLKRRAA